MTAQTTAYYDSTAADYDALHGGDNNPEHIRALERSWPILSSCQVASVLDVGCGTGRTLGWYAARLDGAELCGIDPSSQLLDFARQNVPSATLSVASGEKLPFDDNSIDLVVATGIMHHVDHPAAVIGEMLRVARRFVLVSDHNNFAFGSLKARYVRRWLAATGLLGVATFVKQGLRRQGYTVEDGWWYPYSLLDNFGELARHTEVQYVIPTSYVRSQAPSELQLVQSHLAILASKVAI